MEKTEDEFDDTKYLANKLYSIAHDDSLRLTGQERYYIMEARENLLGLYEEYQEAQNGKA